MTDLTMRTRERDRNKRRACITLAWN